MQEDSKILNWIFSNLSNFSIMPYHPLVQQLMSILNEAHQ